MAVTKADLDTMTEHGCSVPGCDHDHATLFLHGKCHVGGKVEVSYRNGSGLLRIGCRECGMLIAMVKVAPE